MPADAVNYSALAEELNERLSGGRIDKIIMSNKTTLMLIIRAKGANNNLIITAAASPRCYLTSQKITSTATPLSFCLHLRRHIGGGQIESVEARPFERILLFRINARGELGEEIKRIMIVEIMGKYSNVVITDENYKVTDALKHITLDEERPIIPGLVYAFPVDERLYPTDCACDGLSEEVEEDELPSVMIKRLRGLSMATANEILYRAVSSGKISEGARALVSSSHSPTVYYDENGPTDFSFCDYATKTETRKTFPTLSEAMDEYYLSVTADNGFTLAEKAIKRVLTATLDKQKKKLGAFVREYENAKDYDSERIIGELLTANLYKIKNGDSTVVVDNWYDGTQMEIKLTENSPQEDAQKHFKRYQKKKRTVANLEEQISNAELAIDYLESVETALSLATNEEDIRDIAEELEVAGYLTRQNGKKKTTVSEPRKFTVDGYEVLVGKSNVQNDKITKEARGEDIWLHTQGFHGSHVIIKARGKEVPHSVIEKAGGIAAFFSKARQSENVPVDYTKAKNVYKKRGAAPGKVDYFGAKTVYVTPTPPGVEK